MMSSKLSFSQIKKNIGLSIIAQVISLIVSFLMNLILPKFISEYQYSLWQMYLLYVGYVGILHFGLLDGIVLRYSQYDYEELDKPRIRSQFKLLLVMTSGFSLLGVLCSFVFGGADTKLVFIMTAIGIVTRTMFNYTSYSFQITNRIKHYAGMIIGYRSFYGIGVIILLLLGVRDFYYFCLIDLCSDIFGILYSARNNKGMYWGVSLKFRDAIAEAKENISAGIMLMVSNWSAFLLTGSARLIIQWHWDIMTFGKVSFAFSVTNLFLVFVSAISIVLFPSLKRTDPDRLPELYKRIRNLINPLLIIILLFYYPGCWILEKWLPAYSSSLSYLGILLPLILFSSKINLLTNNYLKALRKEKTMLFVNLTSVGIAVCMFVISAYLLNNLKLVLIAIVLAIMTCSVLSESAVMKALSIFEIKKFVGEVIMTVIFIASTVFFSQMIGMLIYGIAVMIYLFLIRKTIYSFFADYFAKRKHS